MLKRLQIAIHWTRLCGALLLLLACTLIASAAIAQELGERIYRMGGDAQFRAAVGAGIALGSWQGELVFQAGEPDEAGAAAVTGSGIIWVDILGGSQGRSCRRFDSCLGTLYCDGGVNSDVSATHDSEGCQGVAGGSGNLPVVTLMSGAGDSGAGSLVIQCEVAEANYGTQGAMPDCLEVPDGDGVDSYAPPRPIVFTTGQSSNEPLNRCGNFARTSTEVGEAFSCQDWTVQGSPGVLAATMLTEEQEGTAFDVSLSMVLDDTSCGNGVLDPGEDCDTAGESQSCDADCSAASCGDGTLNVTAGEACESEEACNEGDVCGLECACIPEPVCGNQQVEQGETCDTGSATESCDADCSVPECGDGVVNPAAGEECESGSDCDVGQVCAPGCGCVVADVCGNGVLEPDEQCDDGNAVDADGCNRLCRAELPFELAISNLNLLHDVFEDNDILDRLRLAADALAEVPPDIATFQEVAFVGDEHAHQILIADLLARYGLEYYGTRYGDPSAGQAVISRWPLTLGEQELLPDVATVPEFPDRRWFGRVVAHAPIGRLDVYALHFCSDCDHDERAVQAAAALDFVSSTRESGHPFIVGADFNAHRGTAPDANPQNDEPVDVLMNAGWSVLFDGFDAPCNAPDDRSGCTSGQGIYASEDATTRRIDNIMLGNVGGFSSGLEVGPTETFADMRSDDPHPECALEPAVSCSLTSECPLDHECTRGACVAVGASCQLDTDCSEGSICRLDLWPSDHHGVRSRIRLVPEPAGVTLWGTSLAALWLTRLWGVRPSAGASSSRIAR